MAKRALVSRAFRDRVILARIAGDTTIDFEAMARAHVRRIVEPERQAAMFSALARVLAEEGRTEGAVELIGEAFVLASTADQEVVREVARDAAIVLALAGRIDELRAIAHGLMTR